MRFTAPQQKLLAHIRRCQSGMLFDRNMLPVQRQVATNLLKKGAVIKMRERLRPAMQLEPCYVVNESVVPKFFAQKTIMSKVYKPAIEDQPAKSQAISMIRQALNDLERGDRIDALDSLRIASNTIRDSMPQNQPKSITPAGEWDLRSLGAFVKATNRALLLARERGFEITCRPLDIKCVISPAKTHADTPTRMKLDASFDIHIQKKDA